MKTLNHATAQGGVPPHGGKNIKTNVRSRVFLFSCFNKKNGFTPTPKFFGVSSRSERGFTLIELLIAIGITLVLVAAASSVYGNLQVSTQLNEASAQITQDLRLAREQSRAGVNGAAHGIKFATNQYIVFQGASSTARNTAHDRVNTFSDAFFVTTTFVGNEIVFSAGMGIPSATGTVSITHTVSGNRTVIVNSSGVIIGN